MIPSKPQALPQEEIPDVPAPAATLQMTTVDAAIPSVIVFDPKLPPFQAD